jgi:hypothetical protein
MIKHKETGQEISLKGLNDIMSGKNPQYPIKFVPDFTQAAKSVVETMLEERKENFTKEVNVTTYDDDGTKRTVKKNKILTGDGSNYNTELTAAMDLMMNDKENMPGYWADLTKDLPVNDQTPWLNTDEQRKEAISLMYTAADNAWGPKTNVETTSETTIEQKPSSDSEGDSEGKNGKGVSHDHNNWIEQNILSKQKVINRYPTGDVEEEQELTLSDKKRKVLERIRLFSPSKFVYGDDPRVDMKNADPNKLYELNKVPGAGTYNAIEVPISDKDLKNKNSLNKILIDYSKKYDVI